MQRLHKPHRPTLFLFNNKFGITTILQKGGRCAAVGWGTALQAGRTQVQFPMVSLEFFIGTMALGSTQPVTEINTRNISCGVKAPGV